MLHACDFFGYLSTFAVSTYIIPAGCRNGGSHPETKVRARTHADPLSSSRLLSSVIAIAQAFFRCLSKDGAEPLAQWLKKLKKKMERTIFLRDMHEGTGEQGNVEHEIFLKHVRLLCAALARANSKESAMWKLCVWYAWSP